MKKMKSLILGFLVGLCLGVVLFAAVPVVGQGGWNPWADINDDGKVNILDCIHLGNAFGTSGTPLTKASVQYDSGWIDVGDKAGQYFDVVHNLNSADVMVDITGKTTADGAVHQRNIGGTDFVAGWNKTYGGTNDDVANALVQTGDGGYALAGCTNSFGAGDADFWLVKADASGTMQWNKTYGGTNDDVANALVQTGDGGYALAGCTNSFGAGGGDFWLVKADASGTMQWNKTYGGTNYEQPMALVQTSDGGYALAGFTSSFGAGGYDAWLVKTDSVGTMQWNKTYGGTDYEHFAALVQTGDGGYALGGETRSFGAGGGDFWLVKADASGTMQWNKTYGGTNRESVQAFVQTVEGGYALAGGLAVSSGDSGWDAWLVKADASGTMQWNKTYGGTDMDNVWALVQTGDGGYALAGRTISFGAGDADFWLVKADASGTMQWNKTYGGTGLDGAQALVQTFDGGYALAGWTNSFGVGSQDAWLVKTDAAGNTLDGFKYGLAWVDSTANSITLYRGTDDAYWNYVRVRVWKVKESP